MHTQSTPIMSKKKPGGRSRSASASDECLDFPEGAEAMIPAGHEIESVTRMEESNGDGKGGTMHWLYIVYRPIPGGIGG